MEECGPIIFTPLLRAAARSEYQAARPRLERFWLRDEELCARLRARGTALTGYCPLCRRLSAFALPAADSEGFREALACSECRLIGRVRAALWCWRERTCPRPQAAIYLSEQLGPLFPWLRSRHPSTVGSEFLGPGRVAGEEVEHPVGVRLRHEDLRALSFPDRSFDHALCFDVLEHLDEHFPALREFARVLRPGGVLALTVPFDCDREAHRELARRRPDGLIEHLEPPVYHGDPLAPQGGVLCFRIFGWQLLAELRAAGFAEVELNLLWSPGHGLLGWPNLVLLARR